MRETTPALYIYPDGREVCRDNKAGKLEYERRRRVAWNQQGRVCAICKMPLWFFSAVSDHIQPRGMGGARRDDRQENIQATHSVCNYEKGSKRA